MLLFRSLDQYKNLDPNKTKIDEKSSKSNLIMLLQIPGRQSP